MAFFKKSGDQLAKEAIADYKKGNDEISVIKRLEQALQLGLKIYPLDEIYKYIGAAYDELSLPDKAQQAYEKALTFNPKNHTVLSNLGLIYETRGNSMKALEYYKASLESNPENSFALHNIGVMLYREGNFIEALGYFKRTIKLNPHLSTSHAMMSRCYAYIGQFEKAQASFIQAGKCGYDNIKNLRSELREIKKELPRVLFDHDKFVAFCYMVCPNCDDLMQKIKACLASPFEFFIHQYQRKEDEFITSFAIYHALHWYVLVRYLIDREIAIECDIETEPLELFDYLIRIINKRDDQAISLNSFSVSEKLNHSSFDVFADDEMDFPMFSVEELLTEFSNELLARHAYQLLQIWLDTDNLILCPVKQILWEQIDYPFKNHEGGFGTIRPLATADLPLKDIPLH